MNVLVSKLKEVLYSVLPIIIIVMVLNFTIAPLAVPLIVKFLVCAVLIIIGLSIFLFGVDIGISPIGNIIGAKLAKTNKIWVVVVAGLIIGLLSSIAEPDLHILAGQVDLVTSGLISQDSIVVMVAIGIALLLSVGLTRIVYNISLQKVLIILYSGIFILALFTPREFLAVSFDASGATTGVMTVPFILALAVGVSAMKKDSKASENDSFGLVAIASTGAIFSVMIMSILSQTEEITGNIESSEAATTAIGGHFIQLTTTIAVEAFMALLPILLIFLVFQKYSFKLSKKAF